MKCFRFTPGRAFSGECVLTYHSHGRKIQINHSHQKFNIEMVGVMVGSCGDRTGGIKSVAVAVALTVRSGHR